MKSSDVVGRWRRNLVSLWYHFCSGSIVEDLAQPAVFVQRLGMAVDRERFKALTAELAELGASSWFQPPEADSMVQAQASHYLNDIGVALGLVGGVPAAEDVPREPKRLSENGEPIEIVKALLDLKKATDTVLSYDSVLAHLKNLQERK